MYDFFKNIAEINSCALMGACSIHPSVNALYQIILNEIREISFYLVKLNAFNITDKGATRVALEGLSTFLINTSYNQEKYLKFLDNLFDTKIQIKEKYLSYCRENEVSGEIINTNFFLKKNATISELINFAQNNFINKQKNIDKKRQRLFETITLFARLCAIELVKIKKFDENFDEYDFEVVRFFALTNSYFIRNEKIIRRIYQFSNFAKKIILKLFSIYEEKYGEKKSAKTTISLFEGHCILVSGDDLDELEKLIKTIEDMKTEHEISIYTHGPLFLAHFYPYFKNSKYLKGHFGTNNAQYDFSVFDGVILITQNFIQKIDSLYKGEIFSNKLISFTKVFDIENNNYSPVIETALKMNECKKSKESTTIEIDYDKNKIKKIIDDENIDEIVLISGNLDKNFDFEKYKNKKIINLDCSLESEILFNSLDEINNKNIKVTLFIAQCNLKNLLVLLTLLNQEIDLTIANCPQSLINPHVIECLRDDFNVNII